MISIHYCTIIFSSLVPDQISAFGPDAIRQCQCASQIDEMLAIGTNPRLYTVAKQEVASNCEGLPSGELTYPSWGKRQIIFKIALRKGYCMLVYRRLI